MGRGARGMGAHLQFVAGPRQGDMSSKESSDETEDLERKDKLKEAQKRWKIVCLLRTADVESDETARKEKIQVSSSKTRRRVCENRTALGNYSNAKVKVN